MQFNEQQLQQQRQHRVRPNEVKVSENRRKYVFERHNKFALKRRPAQFHKMHHIAIIYKLLRFNFVIIGSYSFQICSGHIRAQFRPYPVEYKSQYTLFKTLTCSRYKSYAQCKVNQIQEPTWSYANRNNTIGKQ